MCMQSVYVYVYVGSRWAWPVWPYYGIIPREHCRLLGGTSSHKQIKTVPQKSRVQGVKD